MRGEGRERRPLTAGQPLLYSPKLFSSSPKLATQSARPEPCKTGEILTAGLIHPLLLELVSTNCPTIIRLESGRASLMSKGRVCPEILVICLGFLLTAVGGGGDKQDEMRKDKINIGNKTNIIFFSLLYLLSLKIDPADPLLNQVLLSLFLLQRNGKHNEGPHCSRHLGKKQVLHLNSVLSKHGTVQRRGKGTEKAMLNEEAGVLQKTERVFLGGGRL